MKVSYRILIVSLIFALALWLYIKLNMSYSVDISIPIEVHTLKSQALSEEIPQSIDVKINGKGWELIDIMLSKNLKYNLDVSKLKKDSKIITQQFVNERLNLQPNISILGIDPDTIDINFDKVTEKVVPIRSNIVLQLRDGYGIVGKADLSPDSVTVRGSSYVVNKIKYIPTEKKVFANVNSNIEGVLNLKDTLQNLISLNVKQVRFSFEVQLSAEKNFDDVEVKVLNVPENKEVLLIPPRVNISLRGGVDQLSKLEASSVEAEVEFGKIENDTLGFILPEIRIPDDLSLLGIEPSKLQYIVKNKL